MSSSSSSSSSSESSTGLFDAIRSRNLKLVARLVKANDPATCGETDADGQSALHIAADLSAIDIVTLLVGARAAVDARDKNNWTPLHAAASSLHQSAENLDIISYLLDYGTSHVERESASVLAFDLEYLEYLLL